MDLKEAREMYPGFPKTGAPGDKTAKKIRKQQRMILRRRKKGLA
jgi:hypothetical protein